LAASAEGLYACEISVLDNTAETEETADDVDDEQVDESLSDECGDVRMFVWNADVTALAAFVAAAVVVVVVVVVVE
jgi:hypothetical protein